MSEIEQSLPPGFGVVAARRGLLAELKMAFAGPKTRRRPRVRPAAPIAVVREPVEVGGPPPEGPAPAALRSVPAPARLPMPTQDLARPAERSRGRLREDTDVPRHRLVLIAGSLAIALFEGLVLGRVLGRDGVLSPWETVTLLLSVLLSAWLGFGFVSATAGFLVSFAGADRRPRAQAVGADTRTAILIPTYNEDPGLIFAAAQAIAEEVGKAGLAPRCDLFVLSDTRDPQIASAEAAALLRTRARLGEGAAIYYRRRAQNTDRKAGNLGEWVETQGGDYDYMLVLDADSLMSGDSIAELVAQMDAEPTLGLLQTVPTIVNAATPFARLQQFANRLYGPVFARGLQWWSGSAGNYLGHNAILRVAAFAACARLPHLPGKRPFGGHIMSHDFVEAALLRRAGWGVRMIATLPGSYEESPPTLLDTAARDRRWCQGNLQHVRVLATAGLHWVSRLHLLCGIFAYVTPLLWLALLVSGAVVWPEQHIAMGSRDYAAITGLFAMALALLAAPKIMALLLALGDAELRRGFGGARRLVLGVVVESVASMLTTPVMMVMQSVAVIDVLAGRDSGWSAQHREGVELSRREAWRAHGGHVLLGALGAVGAFFLSRSFFVWT
ncbi:MAG: glucans biosynthesis glucosyltransferase MdoH, partial [Phenylobacterium sp.]|nr:glucans biosynthesis glucosyltransferase MdoH [Phenylobacterium sp.]